MAKTGWQLAADLSQLKVVATVDLPMLGFNYAELNRAVAGTAEQETEAFVQPIGSGGMDQVFGEWTSLRDQLQNILGRTANVLQATGQVLAHIVDVYAATDRDAARSLESVWRNGPPQLDPTEQVPPGPPPDVDLK